MDQDLEVAMDKKAKQGKAQPQKKGSDGKGSGALSEAQLDKVSGGFKVHTDFNPQPEPPGRHVPGT
jgi:hypothetical protein